MIRFIRTAAIIGVIAMVPGVSALAGSFVSPAPLDGLREFGRQHVVPAAGSVIPPSVALQAALQSHPGSQGLSVRLLQGAGLVYVVRIKTGNKVQRILVDAQTGQVIGRR